MTYVAALAVLVGCGWLLGGLLGAVIGLVIWGLLA